MRAVKIKGLHCSGDCLIKDVEFTFELPNQIEVFISGIGTLDSKIAPDESDGFSVMLDLPDGIFNGLANSIEANIKKELKKYKVD